MTLKEHQGPLKSRCNSLVVLCMSMYNCTSERDPTLWKQQEMHIKCLVSFVYWKKTFFSFSARCARKIYVVHASCWSKCSVFPFKQIFRHSSTPRPWLSLVYKGGWTCPRTWFVHAPCCLLSTCSKAYSTLTKNHGILHSSLTLKKKPN